MQTNMWTKPELNELGDAKDLIKEAKFLVLVMESLLMEAQ